MATGHPPLTLHRHVVYGRVTLVLVRSVGLDKCARARIHPVVSYRVVPLPQTSSVLRLSVPPPGPQIPTATGRVTVTIVLYSWNRTGRSLYR